MAAKSSAIPDDVLAELREVASLIGTATESYERVCKAVQR